MNCEHRTLNATESWTAPSMNSAPYRCRCADCGAKGQRAATVAEAVEGFHAYYPIFPEVSSGPAVPVAAAGERRIARVARV